MLAVGAMGGGATMAAGVSVNHLSVNNTLVRVDGEGRYLLLPVEECNDDATVQVLIDGKLDRTIHVRLAKSKVDYMVPLSIEGYKGHEILLNVQTTQNRGSLREAKDDVCWKTIELSDTFDVTNTEKYRPAYHHTPLYGWMNDPNGMFYKDGVWHLYYQYNPYGSKWQNMTWGHSTSKDLIHWQPQPLAIEPDALGAIFSGSCAIDHNNTSGFGKDAVIAMYTSAAASQVQSLAYSLDNGTTFTKHTGNPVLPLESEARDPKIFWNAEIGQWNLVLAHALEHEILIFTSPDLKNWTLQSAFGKGLGCQDGVWECPDLFKLKVDGSDTEKWMLICNINPGGPYGGSATQYFVGDFDGKTFTPDLTPDGKVPTKWMDFGKDHYATVTWSDTPEGRRTAIGWMSNWQYAGEVPTMQFRSANTLPREVGLFEAADGQVYASSAPAKELEALRGPMAVHKKRINVTAKAKSLAIPSLCEITCDIDPRQSKEVILTLSNAKGEQVKMTYDVAKGLLYADRNKSGNTGFSHEFGAVTAAPVFAADGRVSLRIYIDRSSIEIFEKDGRFAMTNLIFPTEPYNTLSCSSVGGKAEISNLKIYTISN